MPKDRVLYVLIVPYTYVDVSHHESITLRFWSQTRVLHCPVPSLIQPPQENLSAA